MTQPPPLIAADIPAESIVRVIGNSGMFGVGALFGGGLSFAMFWLASRERENRVKNDLEREKELLKQAELKDQRIGALHAQLETKVNELASKSRDLDQCGREIRQKNDDISNLEKKLTKAQQKK